MMLLKGNFESVIDPLMSAFKEVCRNDPLNREPDASIYRHPDGWGFVNIHDTIEYGKNARPVYDADGLKVHDGLFMIHARKTSTGEPVGVGFVHPFHAFDAESEYWLSHNGDFDKATIAEYMEIPAPGGESDTQVFFDLFMRQPGNARNKLQHAIKIVNDLKAIKSIANLFLVSYNRISGEKKGMAYTDAPEATLYGENSMLYSSGNSKMSLIFSSSVAFSGHFKDLDFRAIEKLPRGKIIEI
ncbi:MAG: class II glutamine amidotransferase [Thermoplasmata archaeon]